MCIEAKRIRFLIERDGLKGARAWIERTLLVGMVTDRDIVLRAVAEGDIGGATARQVMSPKIFEVLRNMSENRVWRA